MAMMCQNVKFCESILARYRLNLLPKGFVEYLLVGKSYALIVSRVTWPKVFIMA